MPNSNDIRRQFIEYFQDRHGHTVVPSSPVVPHDDPTLLFTNAGMNQFKDVFLATVRPPCKRAVNSQKCIRAGGKHNDLEDVGKDTYHHTFFEMLGNWSFGDYFKEQAIAWAWDLLTNVWALPKDRLYVTVFKGDEVDGVPADDEAAQLWTTVTDLDPSHLSRWGKKDNFWEMADTGPCGPNSEIHIDLTPDKSGAALVNCDPPSADVIELWNLVFIEFNRSSDGKLTPLPDQHVDTGLGYERLCAVLQGKSSDYDTDVFAPLFAAIRDVTGAAPYTGSLVKPEDIAFRVLADHIRTLTFALTDGAHCGNEGRDYVLRRILRRAVRYGRQNLGVEEPFFYRLVPAVVDAMADAFPELKPNATAVADELRVEEESFSKTLTRGIGLEAVAATDALEAQLKSEGTLLQIGPVDWQTRGDPSEKIFSQWKYVDERDDLPATRVILVQKSPNNNVLVNVPEATGPFKRLVQRFCRQVPTLSGDDAFQLYDTYGFPLDLTQLMAEERGMTVEVATFATLMEQARHRSRAVGAGVDGRQTLVDIVQRQHLSATRFVGYGRAETIPGAQGRMGLRLYERTEDGYQSADWVHVGDQVAVVVDATPFYAEAGGQVGDTGVFETIGEGRVEVTDTIKIGDVTFHLGKVVHGQLKSGQASAVALAVDRHRRANIMINHTGTHLLNRALRVHVNPRADQKGSLVDDEKLRFDFSHLAPLTAEQVAAVEQMVNADIAADLPVYAAEAPQAVASKIRGLRAVFGERYPPRVRVVSIGVPVEDLLVDPQSNDWLDYSIEFCGGTHLRKTGEAEGFVIVSEEAVAKGVRRITALTGPTAHRCEAEAERLHNRLEALESAADPQRLPEQVADLTSAIDVAVLPVQARIRLRGGLADLQELARAEQKKASKAVAGGVTDEARRIADQADGNLVIAAVPGADPASLRIAMDVIRKKRPEAAMLLAAVTGQKVAFLAAVPQNLIGKGLEAGDWVRRAAEVTGGRGGGRSEMAQAGGKDPSKLEEALEVARAFAEGVLK